MKIFEILCSVIGISIGQIMLKLAASNLHNGDAWGFWLGSIRINAFLIFGVAILGCATLLWVWVLKEVPLSLAYPFMALAFIIVPVLSHFLLGEPLSWRQMAGCVLVVLGLLVISA